MVDLAEVLRHANRASNAAIEADIAARRASDLAQEAWAKAGKAKAELEIITAMLDLAVGGDTADEH